MSRALIQLNGAYATGTGFSMFGMGGIVACVLVIWASTGAM